MKTNRSKKIQTIMLIISGIITKLTNQKTIQTCYTRYFIVQNCQKCTFSHNQNHYWQHLQNNIVCRKSGQSCYHIANEVEPSKVEIESTFNNAWLTSLLVFGIKEYQNIFLRKSPPYQNIEIWFGIVTSNVTCHCPQYKGLENY